MKRRGELPRPPTPVVRPRGEKGVPVPGAGMLVMTVFLASLSMLFAASLVAYAVIRVRAERWRPEDASGYPLTLWAGTLCLIGCSVVLHRGLVEIRAGHQGKLVRTLWLAGGLALGFLAFQSWNGHQVHRAGLLYGDTLYGFTFFMLSGLHALHVLGGMIALGVVIVRAHAGAYSWAHYAGVRLCTVYWHFLDIVWLVIVAVLVLTD